MKKIILFGLLLFSGNVFAQGMYGVNYSLAVPLGQTEDFISNISWQGFGFDWKYMLTERFSSGISAGWKVFYDEKEGSFTSNTQTITGRQYRYINAIPVYLTFDFYKNEEEKIRPYGGFGLGTIWVERRTDMGIYTGSDNNWHFGIAPEIGLMVPLGLRTSIYASLNYNVALKAKESITYSFIDFHLGFIWK